MMSKIENYLNSLDKKNITLLYLSVVIAFGVLYYNVNYSIFQKEIDLNNQKIISLKNKLKKTSLSLKLKNLKIKLKKLKKAIQNITQKAKNRKFLVLHPAFVYFANEYGLEQIPIEANGKKPSLKEIIKLLSIAKKEKIKTLIVSPEFSQKSANIIAKELNIKVTKISPLSLEWDKNLIRLSKAISQ